MRPAAHTVRAALRTDLDESTVGVLGFDLRDPACMLAAKVDMCGVAVQFPVKPSRIAGGLVVTFWKPEFSR
jgi:hypothetical protein